MNINIKFGIDVELERIKKTLEKLDWYNSQGYNVKLPKNINKKSSKKEIRDKIIEEFNESEYVNVKTRIKNASVFNEQAFFKKLNDVFGNNISKEVHVYLIAYGVYGSYNLPNTIFLRFNQKNIVKTIIHEIIHLLIEEKIQKYKIEHWEKERIVDLILNSEEFIFLNYDSWQKKYKNTEKYIDPLFKKYFFKDKHLFFKRIKENRLSS